METFFTFILFSLVGFTFVCCFIAVMKSSGTTSMHIENKSNDPIEDLRNMERYKFWRDIDRK